MKFLLLLACFVVAATSLVSSEADSAETRRRHNDSASVLAQIGAVASLVVVVFGCLLFTCDCCKERKSGYDKVVLADDDELDRQTRSAYPGATVRPNYSSVDDFAGDDVAVARSGHGSSIVTTSNEGTPKPNEKTGLLRERNGRKAPVSTKTPVNDQRRVEPVKGSTNDGGDDDFDELVRTRAHGGNKAASSALQPVTTVGSMLPAVNDEFDKLARDRAAEADEGELFDDLAKERQIAQGQDVPRATTSSMRGHPAPSVTPAEPIQQPAAQLPADVPINPWPLDNSSSAQSQQETAHLLIEPAVVSSGESKSPGKGASNPLPQDTVFATEQTQQPAPHVPAQSKTVFADLLESPQKDNSQPLLVDTTLMKQCQDLPLQMHEEQQESRSAQNAPSQPLAATLDEPVVTPKHNLSSATPTSPEPSVKEETAQSRPSHDDSPLARKGSARIRALQENLIAAPLGGGPQTKPKSSPGKLPAHLKGVALPGMGGPPPTFPKRTAKAAEPEQEQVETDTSAEKSSQPTSLPGKLPAHLKSMPLPGFGRPPSLRRKEETGATDEGTSAGQEHKEEESPKPKSVGKLKPGLVGMKIPMPGAGPPPSFSLGKRRGNTADEADFSKPALAPEDLEHPTSSKRRATGALGRRPSSRRHRRNMVELGDEQMQRMLASDGESEA